MNHTVHTHTQVDWGGLNVNTVCKQAPGIYNGKGKSGAGKTLFPSNVISMFFPIAYPVSYVSGSVTLSVRILTVSRISTTSRTREAQVKSDSLLM